MDQDFHYYGTYYAARLGGFSQAEATDIAKASNFIDFLNNDNYAGIWRVVRENQALQDPVDYTVVGEITSPRYTFQGTLSSGVGAEDGLWCSYHFTPGNYPDPPNTPTTANVHGAWVKDALPPPFLENGATHHTIRSTPGVDSANGILLNRPMSPFSRSMITDTIRMANDNGLLEGILARSVAGWELLKTATKAANIGRFRLMLLGARAHILADTWAHQDFSGANHKTNTYWDVGGSGWGRQSIDYKDTTDEWKNVVLSATNHENLKAVPNGVSYLGHGWMGHLPDYSFIQYRYKPCWRNSTDEPFVRNNPVEYKSAFLELCSMFSQTGNRSHFNPGPNEAALAKAQAAISSPCEIANKQTCPRYHSAQQWQARMTEAGISAPTTIIDTRQEPDPGTVLPGMLTPSSAYSRYGYYYVTANSDLYLFQIAADYHFQWAKNYLKTNRILTYSGSWSKQIGAVAPAVKDLW
jgi:hypothetical protein